MDERTYAAVTEVCRLLAGRLSDDLLSVIRGFYYGGEPGIAESTLLLGLAQENVGITPAERDLVRTVMDHPDDPDLAQVPAIVTVPAPPYRFLPTGPPPDPTRVDALLVATAPDFGIRRLLRTWREPLDGAPEAAWLYLAEIDPGADELRVHSGLDATLAVTLRESRPLEVLSRDAAQPPYRAAARAAARQIWPA